MCGIAGFLSFKRHTYNQGHLEQMLRSIKYRGPDAEGYFFENHIGLAHCRLSIVDLSASANQPMHYLDRYVVIFNGEIYNYVELREQLKDKGYSFRTQSDTEVLLAMYDYKGVDCLKEMDGMFAFALWDRLSGELFCARDRFGEKPFYYTLHNGTFFFASEIKALTALGLERKPNHTMLYNFLNSGYSYNPNNCADSFYEGVHKLPPSHYIVLGKERQPIVPKSFWTIEVGQIDRSLSFEQAASKLDFYLQDSISKRIRNDVVTGSSLSGGLDSASITFIANALFKSKGIKMNTFTAVFDRFEHDESWAADLVNRDQNIIRHHVKSNEKMLLENINKLIFLHEEPIRTSSVFSQYCLLQEAKRSGVKVMLDGQGADEILAGYPDYLTPYFQELLSSSPARFLEEWNQYVRNFSSPIHRNFRFYAQAFLPFVVKRLWFLKQQNRNFDRQHYFDPEFLNAHHHKSYTRKVLSEPSLDKTLRNNISRGSLEEVLRFVDRNSMAHGVESRLPFLSHEMVEFLFKLPSHYKIHHGWTKYLLRESMRQKLPPEIVWRKDKIGFMTPQSEWMNDKSIQKDVLASIDRLVEAKILNHKAYKFVSSQDIHEEQQNFRWNIWVSGKLMSKELFNSSPQ